MMGMNIDAGRNRLSLDCVVHLHSAVLVRCFDEGILLVHAQRKSVKKLTGKAVALWQAIDNHTNIATLLKNDGDFVMTCLKAWQVEGFVHFLPLPLNYSAPCSELMRNNLPFYSISSQALLVDVEGSGVLIQQSTGKRKSVNPVGVVIWNLLLEDGSMAALIDAMRDKFPTVPLSTLQCDIVEYIDELVSGGFLQLAKEG